MDSSGDRPASSEPVSDSVVHFSQSAKDAGSSSSVCVQRPQVQDQQWMQTHTHQYQQTQGPLTPQPASSRSGFQDCGIFHNRFPWDGPPQMPLTTLVRVVSEIPKPDQNAEGLESQNLWETPLMTLVPAAIECEDRDNDAGHNGNPAHDLSQLDQYEDIHNNEFRKQTVQCLQELRLASAQLSSVEQKSPPPEQHDGLDSHNCLEDPEDFLAHLFRDTHHPKVVLAACREMENLSSKRLTQHHAQPPPKRPCSQSRRSKCHEAVTTFEGSLRSALARLTAWHIHGVTHDVATRFGVSDYHNLKITTSPSIQQLEGKGEYIRPKKMDTKHHGEPIQNCSCELDRTLGEQWPCVDELTIRGRSDFAVAITSQVTDAYVNWINGIESQKGKCKYLGCPTTAAKSYTAKDHITVLDCKRSNVEYLPVDLSQLPSDWENPFRHIKIIAGAMPLQSAKYHQKGLIRLASRNTLVLGSVTTGHEMSGLLMRMTYSFESSDFERILSMHTSLQKHSFVPRIYALHMCSSSLLEQEKCSGVFVGESPGSWNLGNPGGLLYSGSEECLVMAFHVTLCLIRIQILTFMVLGFTLRTVQPARLYRSREGFRPDMVSCLVDSLHARTGDMNSVMPRAKEAICSISDTLEKLGMLPYLPQNAQNLISSVKRWVYHGVEPETDIADDITLLKRFYVICFGNPGPLESLQFLGAKRDYERNTIQTTMGSVEPYGPFAFEVLNKQYAWNQVIIVEPNIRSLEQAVATQRKKTKRSSMSKTAGQSSKPGFMDRLSDLNNAVGQSSKPGFMAPLSDLNNAVGEPSKPGFVNVISDLIPVAYPQQGTIDRNNSDEQAQQGLVGHEA